MSADPLEAHEGLQGEEDHVDEYADAAGGGGAGGVARVLAVREGDQISASRVEEEVRRVDHARGRVTEGALLAEQGRGGVKTTAWQNYKVLARY